MIKEVKLFFKNRTKFQAGKVLLAVSGGVDSMVLWHLLEQAEIPFALAHVNFQLRGKESDDDQFFLEKEAQKRNIKLHVLRAETKELAAKKKQSTQLAAREIRYEWFENLMHKHGYSHLVTAHHLDDSIETFFINLNRGTGLKGLSGISSSEKIFRPLLSFSKEEIKVYAIEHQLSYREDSSNRESNYLRNWFRNKLLPKWEKRNPQFTAIMKQNIERLSESQMIVDKVIEADIGKVRNQISSEFIKMESIRQMKFPKESLMSCLGVLGFNYDQMEQLLVAIENDAVGKIFKSETHRLNLDREVVFIEEKKVELIKEGWIQEDTELVNQPVKLKIAIKSRAEVEFLDQPRKQWLDWDKLNFPLKVRKWEEGDRMQPLGMKGKKKISDILIDAKISLIEKERVFVLCSAENIICLLGFRIDERYKIDSTTTKILQIECLTAT